MAKQKFYWEFVDADDGDGCKVANPCMSIEECIEAAQLEMSHNRHGVSILVGTSVTEKLSDEDLDNCDYTDSVIEILTEVLHEDLLMDIDIRAGDKAEAVMENFLTKWIKQYCCTDLRLVRNKATVHRLPRVEPEKPDTTAMAAWLARCPDTAPEMRNKILAAIQGGKTAKRK